MSANSIISGLSTIDKEVLRRFRVVLYKCIKGDRNELDVLSYRLLDVLREEINLDIYKNVLIKNSKHSPKVGVC